MKKLSSFALTLTLVFSLSVTAFAASDTTELNTGNTSGTTNITYEIDSAYTVTIPSKVTLSADGNASGPVGAENVKIPPGKKLVVKLAEENNFMVSTKDNESNKEASLNYTVQKAGGATNLRGGDSVFEVSPKSVQEGIDGEKVTLNFNLDTDTVIYAGSYTGTLIFTVSVDPIEATEQP